MNYEKKYLEALEKARQFSEHLLQEDSSSIVEYIFPELESERIRKWLIDWAKTVNWSKQFTITKEQVLAWLEKQGEQNPYSGASFKYNGHTFGMCARDGGAEILIDGNLKAFISLDKSFIYPVIPIPSFKAENFYVSKVDGLIHDSTYNSTEKHEPKFHNGDWVTDGYLHCKISDVLDDRYIVDTKFAKRSAITFKRENNYHLWTIQDAKDGDVLVNGSNIFIFHFIKATRLMGYCHVNTDDGRFYNDIGKNECFCLIDAVVTPATNAQRDILFQKMKEAGYEWDSEKKELKIIDWSKHVKYEPNGPSIIDENTEWSEEDEKNLIEVISIVQNISSYDKQYDGYVNWLKSLKQRIKGEKSMEQYISKSAVVKEIEKRGNICKKVALDLRTEENKDYYQGKAEAYKETLDLLDTLEVKEVDLDNELDFVKDAYYYFTSDERSSMKKVAKHFFELGLQRLDERRIKL